MPVREKNPDGPLDVPEMTRTGPATTTTRGVGMQHDPEEDTGNQGYAVVKRGKADQYQPTPGSQSEDPHYRYSGPGTAPAFPHVRQLPGAATAGLPATFGPFAPGQDFATLWNAIPQGELDFAFPTDADQTLSAAQSTNTVFNLSGTATARNLILTAVKGQVYFIINGTTGTVTVKHTSGTGIGIATLKNAILVFNGTNMLRLTADT